MKEEADSICKVTGTLTNGCCLAMQSSMNGCALSVLWPLKNSTTLTTISKLSSPMVNYHS